MNLLKCAILEYTRKPIKYILLGIIFFAVFTGAWIGIQLLDSAEVAQDKMLEKIGAYLQLDLKDNVEVDEDFEGKIDADIRSEILNIQYVKGVNQEKGDYAFPLSFQNVKEHKGENPSHKDDNDLADEMTADSVSVLTNLDCSLIDAFRLGEAELIEGKYAADDCSGVMIEEKLAKENNLQLGSYLTLGTSTVKSVKAKVVGVYRYNGYFEITENNSIGDNIYAMSPFNRIYSSFDIGEKLFQIKREDLPLNIYITQPQYNDIVGRKIKSLDFDWELYGLYNMTASIYKIEGQQISTLLNYAKLILFYVLAIGLVLISIVLNLYAKFILHDMGVFYALGASKKRIILQNLISLMVIALFSSGMALLVASVISKDVCGNLILQTTVFQGTAQMLNGFNGGSEVTLRFFSVRQGIGYGGIVMVVLMLSNVPCIMKLNKKNLRKVLLGQGGK